MKSTYEPRDVAPLFADVASAWWVAGGWAIDLWLGKQTRAHADLDIAILRSERQAFWDVLGTWDLHVATAPGVLTPLTTVGDVLPPLHAVWCRPTASSDWAFELLLNDSEGDTWLFRRDHAVQRPLSQLGDVRDGLPILSPEVVLLYKAKNLREHDREDFEHVQSRLDPRGRRWLAEAIEAVHPGHEWLTVLRSGPYGVAG